MAQPLVSVVIPAYNRENFIKAAVESVQVQNIDDIEIIIVDDCSKDNTVAVVEQMTDPRIRLIKHEQNKGEAGARNTGLRAAQGQYVAYLDSDDTWLPGKLAAQIAAMQNSSDDIGGVYTLHYRLYQDGRRSVAGYPPGGQHLTFENLLIKGASISAGSTLMFKRELYDKVGAYDETAPLYVDWDWLLRLTRLADLKLIPTPYAVYEKNPRYRTGAMQEKAADIFIAKFKNDIDRLPEASRRECLSRINLDIARCYVENEGLKYAWPFYKKAFQLKPIMSPGSFINVLDGILGLNLMSRIDAIVRHPARKQNS